MIMANANKEYQLYIIDFWSNKTIEYEYKTKAEENLSTKIHAVKLILNNENKENGELISGINSKIYEYKIT